ncbi:MAG: hypothetical protein SX243_17615 [Acidobacteriota bacterium]|nr:hypothetical protein [Acidobacteriota bacterium]
MTRKDKEEQIKSWKEGEATGPAGDIELDDSDLENASGGVLEGTNHNGTSGCCGNTEGTGSCEGGTSGCCDDTPVIS